MKLPLLITTLLSPISAKLLSHFSISPETLFLLLSYASLSPWRHWSVFNALRQEHLKKQNILAFCTLTYILPWYFSDGLRMGQMEPEIPCLAKSWCWIDLMQCWVGLPTACCLWDEPLCQVLNGGARVWFGLDFFPLKIINLDFCAFPGCDAGFLSDLKGRNACFLTYNVLTGKMLSSFGSVSVVQSCAETDKWLHLKCSYRMSAEQIYVVIHGENSPVMATALQRLPKAKHTL